MGDPEDVPMEMQADHGAARGGFSAYRAGAFSGGRNRSRAKTEGENREARCGCPRRGGPDEPVLREGYRQLRRLPRGLCGIRERRQHAPFQA
jgi:hypothetical protein